MTAAQLLDVEHLKGRGSGQRPQRAGARHSSDLLNVLIVRFLRLTSRKRKNMGGKLRSIWPVAFFVVPLMGCAMRPAPPSAWTFYDQCARRSSSFIATAECGKANRNAYCEAHNSCSATGNAFVLYTDSLEASVKDHEMTEAEAQRKWVEFRMDQSNAARQQALEAKAIRLQSAPRSTTCYTTGSITNCY